MTRALVVAVLAVASFVPTVAHAQTRIGVVPVQVGAGLPLPREEADAAVLRGIETAGHVAVTAQDVAGRARAAKADLACRTPGCWTALATASQAAHLVAGNVSKRGATFRVELRLVDGATGEGVASEENQCDASDCALGDLVRLSARELIRRTLGRKRAPRAEALVPPPVPPPAPGGAPPAATAQAETPAPEQKPAWTIGRPWTLAAIGSGLALLAAGAALVAIDGAEADEGPIHRHTTRGPGLAAIGVGLALAGAGARFYLGGRF